MSKKFNKVRAGTVDTEIYYLDGEEIEIESSAEIGIGLGLFGSGYAGGASNFITKVVIDTNGSEVDWGDLTTARDDAGALANSTTAYFCGGGDPYVTTVDERSFTIGSNASLFGNLSQARATTAAGGVPTSGVIHSSSASSNTDLVKITYGTSSIAGYGTSLGVSRRRPGGANSSNHLYILGSETPDLATIEKVNLNSVSVANSPNDLAQSGDRQESASTSVEAVYLRSETGSSNTLDKLTFSNDAVTGGVGSLTAGSLGGAASGNTTKALFALGGAQIAINYVLYSNLASTSNFGNLPSTYVYVAGCSDSHGGLT